MGLRRRVLHPGTRVLLPGGKTKPISALRPGDKVLATDTKTGKTSPEAVTAVLVNHDHDLYDLTVKTPSGTGVVHTTVGHPFHDPHLHQWRPASNLKPGEHLKTPVAKPRSWSAARSRPSTTAGCGT